MSENSGTGAAAGDGAGAGAIGAEVARAVETVRRAWPAGAKPTVGLILGSGLGAFADTFEARVAVPFAGIPGFASSTIVGHAGNLVYGRKSGVELVAMQGRIHYYEGHDLARVAFPARVLVAAGCQTLVVTNAAGGVDATLAAGDIVVLRDHLNLLGGSPLRGPNDDSLGPRFPDMTEAYDGKLRALAAAAGRDVGLTLREGVYAASSGPQYETPAEVRMAKVLGGDLVGMSTTLEAIAARQAGLEVLGISLVTNLGAGLSDAPLDHAEVLEAGQAAAQRCGRMLAEVVRRL
jgi:purine-nucleoside phosphorylase